MPPSNPKEPQRIAKLLARAGVASRRDVERMIAEGRIALDGQVLETPATLLASLKGVTVDGQPVAAPAPARLFRFYKPNGVLTAARDPKGRATIYDRLPEGLPRVVPVGRLDLNTEGLLLLTTDGELKRALELPATGVERSYRARAYGNVSQAQLEELMLGVEIDGVRYGSIDANLERRTGANVWIELTLTEGKNREVRRVLEHLGLKVSRLIRTRYGPFYLGDLEPGDVDEVRRTDLITFRTTLAKSGGKAASGLALEVRAKRAAEPKREDKAETPPVNRAERRKAAAKAAPAKRGAKPQNPPSPRARPGVHPTAKVATRARAKPWPPEQARGADVEAKPAGADDSGPLADRPKKRYRPGDRRPMRRPTRPKR